MAKLSSEPTNILKIYTWYREGNLYVNRRYQRKLVWTLEEKQKLIDSILKDYPIPAILLAEKDGRYEIIDGLSIMGRSSLDRTSYTEEVKWHNDTYTVAPNGKYEKSSGSSYEWNTDFLLNFHDKISEDIVFDINLGANHRISKLEGLSIQGRNFAKENLFAFSNTSNPVVEQEFWHKEVNSVYTTGELTYKNAIFLNASVRNDWSSTLPSNNRSYLYPSLGLSTVISELIKMPEFLNYLKLRGSWAEVGNDTDPYQLSQSAFFIYGTIIDLANDLPNSNLKPETTRSTELGVDFRLFESRVNGNFTWYKSNTYDQLFPIVNAPGFGAKNFFTNGGDVQNKGIEIALGIKVINTTDFSWDIDLNFSKNSSLVLDLSEGLNQLTQSTNFLRSYKLVKGEPFGVIYGRDFAKDDQGRVIVDALGLPTVTSGLTEKVANFNPDWLGGISNTFTYKNFSVSTLIDIRQGGTLISETEAVLAGNGLLDYTLKGRDGSLVFGENIFEKYEAVDASGQTNTAQISSEDLWNRLGGKNTPIAGAFVRDASNIRLRELIVGYTVPRSVLEKTNFISSVDISFVGRNLFFFSNKARNLDPEVVVSPDNIYEGFESYSAPTTRSMGFSLKIEF
jgi:hypothetical protein